MADTPQVDAPPPENESEGVYTESEMERAKEALNDLSPDAYLEMESVLNASSDVSGIPEAGGIAFTEFVGAHGGIIHATARAAHPTRAIQMLLESLQYLKSLQPNTQWRIPGSNVAPQASKPVPPAPVQAVAQTPAQAQATPVPAPAAAPQPDQVQYVDVNSGQQAGNQAGNQVMVITKIDITPMPESRVKVEMFAPGHKWPDLKVVNWTVQGVLENLLDPSLGWDATTLITAGSFTGNFAVEWVNSTTGFKQSGEPYKDVKRIALAA